MRNLPKVPSGLGGLLQALTSLEVVPDDEFEESSKWKLHSYIQNSIGPKLFYDDQPNIQHLLGFDDFVFELWCQIIGKGSNYYQSRVYDEKHSFQLINKICRNRKLDLYELLSNQARLKRNCSMVGEPFADGFLASPTSHKRTPEEQVEYQSKRDSDLRKLSKASFMDLHQQLRFADAGVRDAIVEELGKRLAKNRIPSDYWDEVVSLVEAQNAL